MLSIVDKTFKMNSGVMKNSKILNLWFFIITYRLGQIRDVIFTYATYIMSFILICKTDYFYQFSNTHEFLYYVSIEK